MSSFYVKLEEHITAVQFKRRRYFRTGFLQNNTLNVSTLGLWNGQTPQLTTLVDFFRDVFFKLYREIRYANYAVGYENRGIMTHFCAFEKLLKKPHILEYLHLGQFSGVDSL